jgi:hypothetical protein
MVSARGKLFCDTAYHIYDTVVHNLRKMHPQAVVTITFKKTVTIVSNKVITLDEAYDRYRNYMSKYVYEIDNYVAIYTMVSKENMKLIISEKNEKEFGIFDNIKYKVSSPQMNHDLEIFGISLKPIAVVSRFYLPIVRSYYDGTNVYFNPSAISACMTLINIDYRYFAGTKDPICVVNKYRFRGFSICLNSNELKRFKMYSTTTEPWKSRYEIGRAYMGYLSIDHLLFTSGCQDINANYYFGMNGTYHNRTYYSLFGLYFPGHTGNALLDLTAVNSDGYTIPFDVFAAWGK